MEGLTAARLSKDGRIKDVRADHVARYEWASRRLTGHVVDAGCNSGYGSAILADSGLLVTSIDSWAPGLAFAREHWNRPTIEWLESDLADFDTEANAVVAFEVIEHMENPRRFLERARLAASRLLVSVPNEDVWPWEQRLLPEHVRHYRKSEIEALMIECGWRPVSWWGQRGARSAVVPEMRGRTLIVECR